MYCWPGVTAANEKTPNELVVDVCSKTLFASKSLTGIFLTAVPPGVRVRPVIEIAAGGQAAPDDVSTVMSSSRKLDVPLPAGFVYSNLMTCVAPFATPAGRASVRSV